MNKTRKDKQKFYQSKWWKQIRSLKLKDNPFCECDKCKQDYDTKGLLPKLAREVHHIVDLDQDWSLRLDYDNLQSMAKECHSRITIQKLNQKEKPESERIKDYLKDLL